MSTIASPRDRPGPFPRRTNSSITPTSSSRPSLDAPASTSSSPNPNNPSSTTTTATTITTTTTQPKRNNRAALREYYNLRNNPNNNNNNNKPLPSPPTVEITTHPDDPNPTTTTTTATATTTPLPNELDNPHFDAPTYTSNLLQTASLADLLRTHARVLGEMRALDAERKALVYDNYSKLIAATDTIRRMRAARGPGEVVIEGGEGVGVGEGIVGRGGGGGGGTLEKVVDGIYGVAVGLREELRREVDAAAAEEGKRKGDGDAEKRRERTRELAREVIKVPERVRRLVGEGKVEEASQEWERPRRLLVRWKELGVGGEEVGALIEEGDNALRGGGRGEANESPSAAT